MSFILQQYIKIKIVNAQKALANGTARVRVSLVVLLEVHPNFARQKKSKYVKKLNQDIHFFIRTRTSFFAQNLRTIPASAEEQSLKF